VRLSVLAVCLFASLANAQSPLTNSDIIHMFAFGISPAVIKATINKSKAGFDLSPEGLIQLKKSGLNDDIVMAMISKSNIALTAPLRDSLHNMSSGIYYKSTDGYRSVDPGYLTNASSKGFGGSLMKSFSNLVAFKKKAIISEAHSSLQIRDLRPSYLFVLDYPTHNPEEFFLVRLRSTDSTRQIIYEKPTNGTGSIVFNDSLKIDFNIKKIENGYYEISPVHSLSTGEYGFVYSAASHYAGTRYTIYDFSIVEK
jgi:hypothetical protein